MSVNLITRANHRHAVTIRILALACGAILAAGTATGNALAQTKSAAPPAMSGHANADAAQRLVNFVTSVNRDEIALGKLAASKSSNADVRAYAEHVVEDHTNAMAAWAEKVPGWSLTIPDSSKTASNSPKATTGSAAMANGMSEVRDTTTGLRGGTSAAAIHSASLATLNELQSLTGAAFDKAYLSAQRTGHEAVLKELAAQPNNYVDMQTLLTIFRSTVEKHLNDASKLQPAGGHSALSVGTQ